MPLCGSGERILPARVSCGETLLGSGENTVNSVKSGKLVAWSFAILVLMAPLLPARCQTPGLPPPSTIIGTPHRAPDGTIVVDPTSRTPPSSPQAARSRKNAAEGALNGDVHPSASSPAETASFPGEDRPANDASHASAAAGSNTGPTPFRALTPDELDDVSCRAVAWEHLNYDQCRRDLKGERAHVPGTQTGTAGSTLSCTNCR